VGAAGAGASNGGATFHDHGGPFGRTKAKRVVAVDVSGHGVTA
jgi:hypothetical protein